MSIKDRLKLSICCIRNPQQIDVMEHGLYSANIGDYAVDV